MNSPRTTVIVTQRERFTRYESSLASVYDTNQKFDLIYVDMKSPLSIKQELEREAAARGFRIIRLDQIVGQNRARNLALRHTNTEYVAFVDNDVILSSGWLDHLIECADATGAALVGPLCFEGPADRGIVHVSGGDCHIELTEKGNYLAQSHLNARDHISDIAPGDLHRKPTELLEFHCLLVRRSLFDQVGKLDETLPTVADHDDLCILAGLAGEKAYVEPAAAARYEYTVPLCWRDMFYFFLRWCSNWTHSSVRCFSQKYHLANDDPWRRSITKWTIKHHRDLPLPPMGNRLITAIVRTAFKFAANLSSYFPPDKVNVTLYPPVKQRERERAAASASR